MIHSFFTINNLVDNTSNITSPVGELSGKARTYAKDVKVYSKVDGDLNVFNVPADSSDWTITNIDIICNAAATKLCGLANIPTTGTLLAKVNAAVNADSTFMVTAVSPTFILYQGKEYPDWITVTVRQVVNLVNSDTDIKVWLSDSAFLADYPLGEIEIISVIPNLIDLYERYAYCKQLNTANRGTAELITLANQQVTLPVTGYDTISVTIVNHNNTQDSFELELLVAYNGGIIACNALQYFLKFRQMFIDSVGDKYPLIDILVVIPDIIFTTKYYIVPMWDRVAVDNVSLISPIKSPTINVCNVNMKPYFQGPNLNYSDLQISTLINYTVALYNSTGMFVGPSLINPIGIRTWSETFHDYFLVPLNDVNIMQMSIVTQNMRTLLDRLLVLAEAYTLESPLTQDINISVVNGHTYLSGSTPNGVRLYVMTKLSYLA